MEDSKKCTRDVLSKSLPVPLVAFSLIVALKTLKTFLFIVKIKLTLERKLFVKQMRHFDLLLWALIGGNDLAQILADGSGCRWAAGIPDYDSWCSSAV